MRKAVLTLVAFGLMMSGLAVPAAAGGGALPLAPSGYGSYNISSSFTSSTPSIDGRFQPTSGAFTDAGSTPWPFTAPNEWSDAAKYGMFSSANEPPWTTINNLMFFPPDGKYAYLTIEPSGPAAPTSPPWAPSWFFVMNDANNLYLMGMINPANKQCADCPANSANSDYMGFYFANSAGAQIATLSFAFKDGSKPGQFGTPTIIETSTIGGTPSGTITAVNCPLASVNGYIEGTCPSPTVYEASIPLSDLGCTSLPCTVGLYVSNHASPHGNTCTNPPKPGVPVCIPQLYTDPSPSSSVGVNTLISDKATMYMPPTTGTTQWGSIEFNLFAGSCASLEGATATAIYTGTAAVGSSNNGATIDTYTSGTPFTPSSKNISPGDYSWLVRYVPPATGAVYPATPFQGGNTGNVGVQVNKIWYFCEPLTLVPQAPTSIITQVSLSSFGLTSPPSQSVTDTATFINANSPTGNLVFTVYSDSACTNQVFTSTNAITGSSVTSDPFTPTATGVYFWKVSYAGDPNNSPYASTCGSAAPFAEAVVVTSVTTTTFYTSTVTTVSTCTIPGNGVPEFPGAQVGSVVLLAFSLVALMVIRRLQRPGSAGAPPLIKT